MKNRKKSKNIQSLNAIGLFLTCFIFGLPSTYAKGPLEIIGPQEPLANMYCGEDPQMADYTVSNTSSELISITRTFVKSLANDTSTNSAVRVVENTCQFRIKPFASCTMKLKIMPTQCKQGHINRNFPQTIDRALVILAQDVSFESAPITLTIQQTKPPVILGGQYTDKANAILPILYVSHDLGQSWNYKISSSKNVPNDFSTNGLMLVSECTQTVCAAGGHYSDTHTRYPLLAVSNNKGVNWNYRIDKTGKLPEGYLNNGMFSHLSCANDHCAVIGEYSGEYTDGQEKIYPMLATTTNAGLHWKYQVDKSQLPANFQGEGYFNSVHCSNRFCVAAGEYQNTHFAISPMLTMSTDGGAHWSYAIDDSKNLPANYQKGGIFRKAACLENSCIAAGVYINHARRTTFMLARGDRKGQWTYKVDSENQSPLGFFDNAFVYGMSCSNKLCTVVGGYQDIQFNQFPMLITSHDSGKIWKYQVDKTQRSLPTDYYNGGALSAASCSGNTCSAAGYYKDNAGIQYPMLIVSTDSGYTWQYKVQKGLNLPPSLGKYGSFSNVHCYHNRCAATGYYQDATGAAFPIVIASQDGGNTWEYQVASGLPLPADYKTSPAFFTVKCNDHLCYAGGRYFDAQGHMQPMFTTSTQQDQPWKFIVDGANGLPADYMSNGYFTNR